MSSALARYSPCLWWLEAAATPVATAARGAHSRRPRERGDARPPVRGSSSGVPLRQQRCERGGEAGSERKGRGGEAGGRRRARAGSKMPSTACMLTGIVAASPSFPSPKNAHRMQRVDQRSMSISSFFDVYGTL